MAYNKETRLFQNWQIKILCFLIAVLTYGILTYTNQSEREIALPLEVVMPENLQPTSVVPSSVNVVFRGSEKQIYMIDINHIRLRADFSSVNSAGVSSVPVEIDCADLLNYLDISDISIFTRPSVVKVYFE